MPGRVAGVRAGLLCGPNDSVFRLPWWVRRIAAGGDVVAPGDPGRTVQLIDARDLSAWMLDLAEGGIAGAFNGTAPAGHTTMGEALEAAVEATGAGARLRWVPDDVLLAHDVAALGRAAVVDARGVRRRDLGDRHGPRAGRGPALPAGSPRRSRTPGPGCATAARQSSATGTPTTGRAA